MTKNLTCIICPMGCQLEVDVGDEWNEENMSAIDPSTFKISGNSCPRGLDYAKKELTTPERTLTCTVAVNGSKRPLVSAKTKGEVPKSMLLECMQLVKRCQVNAPVKAGDVLIKDILNTGIDLVACEEAE